MTNGYLQVIGLIILGLAFVNASDLIWSLFHPHHADDEQPGRTYTLVMHVVGFVLLIASVAWGAWILFS